MPNKSHGHYCRICRRYKANEKFSGRGHVAHICKACAKRGNKPAEVEPEPPTFVGLDFNDVISDDIDLIPFFPTDESPTPKKKRKRKPDKAKLLRSAQKKVAKALLSEMLANGDVKFSEINSAAQKAGIPPDALRRAKGSLRVASAHTDKGNVWRQPKRNKIAEREG